MKRNLPVKMVMLMLILILILTMACGLIPGSGDDEKEETGSSGGILGEEYRSEVGGFSIKKISGYDFNDVIGIVNMTAPGADPDAGPGIMAVGGISDSELSNEELLDKMKKQSSGLEVSKPEKAKIGGENGLAAEINGSYNGQQVKGRLVLVMVTSTRQFTVIGIAPEEKWKDLEPYFEAVVESVEFFEPKPEASEALEDTPAAESDMPTEEAAAPAVGVQNPDDSLIRQWASSAKASSQYGSRDWSAGQATGEPDVVTCGDNVKAWASYNQYTEEWIELSYDIPVVPTEFNIYQTYNPSQVVEVSMTDVNDEEYLVRETYPEAVDCPDTYTIYIDMEKEIYINKVTIVIDQGIMGWGWAEIDAVELVGYPEGGTSALVPSGGQSEPKPPANNEPAPTNYSGWMAEKNYQGYLKVIPGKTRVGELDGLIGLKGTRSTENWKPRPDHKDTFIYKFEQDDMKAWISVTTDGVVYKKTISVNTRPLDYKLPTVTRENYNKLDAIYKENLSIHYNVMANLLKSPGFLSEQILREDGRMEKTVSWWGPNGEKIGGIFFDDVLTGYATLMYLPPE
ncbi:MAG: hypothetical protein AB9891_21310 [Anaerolineaceae bacterium]